MDHRPIFNVSPEDYTHIILRMERSVLNGDSVDRNVLEQIPVRLLQNSPLLLEQQAASYFHEGNLTEARAAASMAVRGFAQQTHAHRLNSALSLLCMINVRLGELRDAETILVFLKEQWDRQPDELDGRACMALAKGAYLIGDPAREKEFGLAAKERFIRHGQLGEAVQACLDIAAARTVPLSDQEMASIHLFADQQARLDGRWEPNRQVLRSMDCIRQGDWESAVRWLQQVDSQALSYEHRAGCILNECRASLFKGISLSEQERERIQGIVKQYGSDLFIRFEAYGLLYQSAKMDRQHHLVNEYWHCLRAAADITRYPWHQQWIQQQEKHQESSSALSWKVQLFGKLRFVQGSHERQDLDWKRKKAVELLVYLLMQPQFSATKEQVMEDLFGSMYVDKMANQLYVIVHQLKQTLKKELGFEQAVILKDGLVRLQEQLVKETDVEQYEALLREADQGWDLFRSKAIDLYKQAAAMYREFAPEIRYADWSERYRTSLQDKQAAALKRLAREARDHSQYDLSEAYYKNWIALCPTQEEAYQGLIELYVMDSRKQEALIYYRKWEKICMEEFGVDPNPDMNTSFLSS
ncbi:hypothetical protein GCM10023310_62800 [Paenibacillus vulneris]|uniref:BTAD domain-containing putative transcriptional regulator n=1 Tax=Paenibacillus vulneris TaxID=1133364 RepID=A0ABW3URA9_9BACL